MSISANPNVSSMKYAASAGALRRQAVARDRRRASVAHLVLDAAKSYPEGVALCSGAKTMTYADLAAESTRLASYLIAHGAGPDVPVGLCFERSFDFIVSALAVLLSGSAYVPLDPAWPPARRREILENAQAPLLVSRGSLASSARATGTYTIDLDAEADEISAYESLLQPVRVTRENLAYIVYTSGSTGQPKGVEVTQGNLLNLIFWHRETFGITRGDRASQVAGVGFDAAVWETWPHLTAGASLVLVDDQTRTSADLLRNWLVNERITVAFVPTIFAEPMLANPWPAQTALRYFLTGGEALHRHPAPGLPFTVVNNYGPTECTVVATSGVVPPTEAADLAPTIGKPIAQTQVRILDNDGRPVAPGQVGEIYIAGTSVARGYRNNPELTAQFFLQDPLNPAPGSRMYRTGDLGCLLPDGQIVFRGRKDSQEQIRGHRVEPDEIVYALNHHPGVAASAVVARGEACAKSLVAYVVPRERAALSACSSKFRNCRSIRTASWTAELCPILGRKIGSRTPVIARRARPPKSRWSRF